MTHPSSVPEAVSTGVTTTPTSVNKNGRARHVALVGLVFLGGCACGAALATLAIKHAVHHAMQSPQTMAGHIAERLSGFLDLSDEQEKQVEQILVRRHEALTDIRREIQPKLEAELNILEQEIAAVLDDRQRVKWHEHAAAVRSQWLPPIPDKPSN